MSGTTTAKRRQRFHAFATSGAAAVSGIVVNFATEWKSNVLAWGLVLAVTVVSGFLVLSLGGAAADSGSGHVVTHDLKTVVHHNPPAVLLIVVVAAVVLVAGAGGLFANRVFGSVTGSAVSDGTPSPPPSSPLPFTHAVRKITPTCGAPWITPKAPDQITLPIPQDIISYGGWSDWDEVSEGGAAASPGQVMITIQGRSAAEVVLTDLEVRVVARREPIRGTALHRQCGGEGVVRWLSVDLDRDPVAATADRAEVMYPHTPEWERRPIKFPYTVSLSDSETFVIKADTEGCDCDWIVGLHWASQGQTGILPIDDNGRPFRTSSDKNARSCIPLDTEFMCP